MMHTSLDSQLHNKYLPCKTQPKQSKFWNFAKIYLARDKSSVGDKCFYFYRVRKYSIEFSNTQ